MEQRVKNNFSVSVQLDRACGTQALIHFCSIGGRNVVPSFSFFQRKGVFNFIADQMLTLRIDSIEVFS